MFKKLNEQLEQLLEEVNTLSMINIGKELFAYFVKTNILYTPDIQEEDRISWYSNYRDIDFLITLAKGDGRTSGRFLPKNNEIILYIPPKYWQGEDNFLEVAKEYVQMEYYKCEAVFNHELTHFEKTLNNDSNSLGYKRAKAKGFTHYMKHPAELDSQIVGALSNVDCCLNYEDIGTQKEVLSSDKNFYQYIRTLLKYSPNDMREFEKFRKFKPSFFDSLVSKIEPLAKFLNTDTYAKNTFNQAIKDYREQKLAEIS